jgi:hypothetical protein
LGRDTKKNRTCILLNDSWFASRNFKGPVLGILQAMAYKKGMVPRKKHFIRVSAQSVLALDSPEND